MKSRQVSSRIQWTRSGVRSEGQCRHTPGSLAPARTLGSYCLRIRTPTPPSLSQSIIPDTSFLSLKGQGITKVRPDSLWKIWSFHHLLEKPWGRVVRASSVFQVEVLSAGLVAFLGWWVYEQFPSFMALGLSSIILIKACISQCDLDTLSMPYCPAASHPGI